MLTRSGVGLICLAQFTESKLGKTGLTVTVNVYRVLTDGTSSTVLSNQAAFAVGQGVYGFLVPAASNTTGGLIVCVFSTATTTVDRREIVSGWVVELPAPSDVIAWRGATPNNLVSNRVDSCVGAITDNTITANSIASGAITSAKIADDAITAAKIAAGAITAVEAPALANLDAAVSGIASSILSTVIGSLTVAQRLSLLDLAITSIPASSDWTNTERSQIRQRLGVDGTTATPTATPSLSTLTAANIWGHTTRSLTDKEGFKLASDGLDQISADIPNGVATTFRGRLMQLWGRFFNRVERTSNQIITYRPGGTTPNTTQSWSESGATENVGEAT